VLFCGPSRKKEIPGAPYLDNSNNPDRTPAQKRKEDKAKPPPIGTSTHRNPAHSTNEQAVAVQVSSSDAKGHTTTEPKRMRLQRSRPTETRTKEI
jgi:hypothetical protein